MALLIGFLSLTSNPPLVDFLVESQVDYFGDEVIPVSVLGHFMIYFLFAGALLAFFHDTRKGHWEAFFVALFFGGLMEFLQLFVGGRHFSYFDILINGFGASLIFPDHRVGFIERFIRFEDALIEEGLRFRE